MAKVKPINPKKNAPVDIATGDTAYKMAASKKIVVDNATADQGILVAEDKSNVSLTIQGSIDMKGSTAHSGVALNGDGGSLTLTGKKGVITSTGDGVTVGNVDRTTITLAKSASITGAERAIATSADFATINIGLGTTVSSAKVGIFSGAGNVGDQIFINNAGALTGTVTAISVADADVTLVNTGTITGDIKTGTGADYFDLSKGTISAKVYGGAGNDTYVVTNAQLASIVENSGEGDGDTIRVLASGTEASLATANLVNIENLILSGKLAGNAKGNDSNNSIWGNGANNTIDGGKGNDTLYGGAGVDTLTGGEGNDALVGGAGDDVIDGGAGTDTLSYQDSTVGVVVTIAGTATDNIYNDKGAKVTDTAGNGADTAGNGADTVKNVEQVMGSAYNDKITGSDVNDKLWGGAGDDELTGGKGDDWFNGGAGNDKFVGGDGFDTIGTDIESVIGSAGKDTITGDAKNNVIEGGANDDTLKGGAQEAGGDTVSYASATAGVTVDLSLSAAQDTIGAGKDTISEFENVLGSAFADTLKGDATANIITGGNGADTLTGAAGADTFVFGAGSSGGIPSATLFDTITDFTKGVAGTGDLIDHTAAITFQVVAAATAGTAAINAEGYATFDAADNDFAKHLAAVEKGVAAGTLVAGEAAYWQENADLYLFISDATAGLTADDVLIKLTGVTSTDTTLTDGNLLFI